MTIPLPRFPATRDQLIDVMERIEYLFSNLGANVGLCFVFQEIVRSLDLDMYEVIPIFLREMGGRHRNMYFWSRTKRGFAQRALFLAFVLTLLDDGELG